MDKQDELARVIGDACWEKWGDGPWGAATEQVECQAAAVRSFMGSEEAVDRVAAAIVMKADGCDWANMTERARDCEREVARAALSAAIGEEVGVGESEGGEPTGNSQSETEAVASECQSRTPRADGQSLSLAMCTRHAAALHSYSRLARNL